MHLAKFISLGISKEIRSLVSSLVPDVGHPVSGAQACTIFVFIVFRLAMARSHSTLSGLMVSR